MAARKVDYKDFVVRVVEDVWDHLKERHCNQKRSYLQNRVDNGYYDETTGYYNRVNVASTFIGSEHNVKIFLIRSLFSKRENIMNWLLKGNRDKLFLSVDFENDYVKGLVYNGSFHEADDALILLERVGKVFQIKTAYPRWLTYSKN